MLTSLTKNKNTLRSVQIFENIPPCNAPHSSAAKANSATDRTNNSNFTNAISTTGNLQT